MVPRRGYEKQSYTDPQALGIKIRGVGHPVHQNQGAKGKKKKKAKKFESPEKRRCPQKPRDQKHPWERFSRPGAEGQKLVWEELALPNTGPQKTPVKPSYPHPGIRHCSGGKTTRSSFRGTLWEGVSPVKKTTEISFTKSLKKKPEPTRSPEIGFSDLKMEATNAGGCFFLWKPRFCQRWVRGFAPVGSPTWNTSFFGKKHQVSVGFVGELTAGEEIWA